MTPTHAPSALQTRSQVHQPWEEELRKIEPFPGKRRRATRDPATAELQRLWQDGIASGPGRFTSIRQIKKEAQRRVREAAAGTNRQSDLAKAMRPSQA
jgi:hypothetical protein